METTKKEEKEIDFNNFYNIKTKEEKEITKWSDYSTDDLILEEIDFSDVDESELFDLSFIPKIKEINKISYTNNDDFWGVDKKDKAPTTQPSIIKRRDKKELVYFYSYNTRVVEIEESNIDKTNGFYTLLKEEINIRYNDWGFTMIADMINEQDVVRLINNFIYFNGVEKIEKNIHLFYTLMMKVYTKNNFNEIKVKALIEKCINDYDEEKVEFMVRKTNIIFNHNYSLDNDEKYRNALRKVKENTTQYIKEFKKNKKEEVMRLKTNDLGERMENRFWELVEDYSVKKQDVIPTIEKEFNITKKTIYKYSPSIKGVDIVANRIIDYTDKNLTNNMKEIYTAIGISVKTFYEKVKKYGKVELGIENE